MSLGVWYEAQVVDIQDLSPEVKEFTFRLAGDAPFDYEPGMFVTFDLPIHEKRLHRMRSYSIASYPLTEDRLLKFCIGNLHGGLASTFWFSKEIEIGSVLKLRGPQGHFLVPKTSLPDATLVLICTGTGIAPFKAIMEKYELYPHLNQWGKINLIFGTRFQNNILYKDFFDMLAAKYDWFDYDITLSKDSNWPGNKGYVHRIYEKHYVKIELQNYFFMICGSNLMLEEAHKNLINKGINITNLKSESYN